MDAQNLRDVWSFVSGANPDFQGIARLYGVDAPRENSPMKETIARPIRKFDEPKSFFGAEPFHNCSNWRAGGYLEPGLGETGLGAKRTGLCVVGISVEVPTPRMAKILISQTWFLTGVPDRFCRAICNARSRN